MSSERNIVMKLHEAVEEDDRTKVYEIKCKDDEGSLYKILEAIKSLGDRGHSCNIIVDPGTDEEVKVFYDGDGSDRISELNIK